VRRCDQSIQRNAPTSARTLPGPDQEEYLSIAQSVAFTTRDVAAEPGREHGIREFHAVSLMHLDRPADIELCERASKLFPTDSEGRGEYIRRASIRGL
jgi:hypothetical protein